MDPMMTSVVVGLLTLQTGAPMRCAVTTMSSVPAAAEGISGEGCAAAPHRKASREAVEALRKLFMIIALRSLLEVCMPAGSEHVGV
jgi:hypothetical protein